jgi:hypothetical protein
MTAIWLLGGLSIVVATVALVASRPRGDGPDLGSVSGQWLVEYRQSQES